MNIRNTTRFIFYFSLLAILWAAAGCAVFELGAPQWARSKQPSDPLAGWHFAGLTKLDSNKAVTDNYKDYIQTLPPEERKFVAYIEYFEDGTGQHAVKITIGLNGTNWRHVLIYNKDNERIKTIKYVSGHSRS